MIHPETKHDVYVAVLTLDDDELWSAVEDGMARLRDADARPAEVAARQAAAHDLVVAVVACGLRDTANATIRGEAGPTDLRGWMHELLQHIRDTEQEPAPRRHSWWARWRR